MTELIKSIRNSMELHAFISNTFISNIKVKLAKKRKKLAKSKQHP